MPFIPIPNTAQVTVNMTSNGQKVANVYHVLSNVPWTTDLLNFLAVDVRSWWEGSTRIERNGQTCLVEVCARDMTTSTGLQVCVPHGLANCGLDPSDPMPGNATIAIKHGTGQSGRSRRGRSYWVGMSEDVVNGNVVDSTWLGQVVQDMDELRAAINNSQRTLVVASTHSGSTCDVARCKKIPTPRASGITTPITGFAADANVDSQRRRLADRGT